MSEHEKLLQIAEDTLSMESDVLLAIVYGSTAEGILRPDSDVDIAVYYGAPLDAEGKISLVEKLADAAGREVDLVDLHSAHGTLIRQILTKGRVIVKRDASVYELLLKRMVFEEEDYMPYYRRLLRERRERFIHGSRSH